MVQGDSSIGTPHFSRSIAAKMALAVENWFATSKRDLPWRRKRTMWRSIVSEFMLQQTQVSRVVDYFEPFLNRYPTPLALSRATEDEVVIAWSGLGYYRRARALRAVAVAIVVDHRGQVPGTAAVLESLPGIGRYTAGAVTSIVLGARDPIVDGNVSRVMLRVLGETRPSSSREVINLLWRCADEYIQAARDPSAANEGLMELGALICTPRNPRCDECPIGRTCRARAQGVVDRIPVAKARATKKEVSMQVLASVHRGRVYLVQRPSRGLWAGLWFFPACEAKGETPPWKGAALRRVGIVRFDTTAQRVHFQVWAGCPTSLPAGGKWVSMKSGAQLRVGAVAKILKSVTPVELEARSRSTTRARSPR